MTHGIFPPGISSENIRKDFESLSLAEVREIEVRNRTTREDAVRVMLGGDGSYAALVAMREGENGIEVSARSIDGRKTSRQLSIRFRPGATEQPHRLGLRAMRDRLQAGLAGVERRGTLALPRR